jgi:hypothetical protein
MSCLVVMKADVWGVRFWVPTYIEYDGLDAGKGCSCPTFRSSKRLFTVYLKAGHELIALGLCAPFTPSSVPLYIFAHFKHFHYNNCNAIHAANSASFAFN